MQNMMVKVKILWFEKYCNHHCCKVCTNKHDIFHGYSSRDILYERTISGRISSKKYSFLYEMDFLDMFIVLIQFLNQFRK